MAFVNNFVSFKQEVAQFVLDSPLNEYLEDFSERALKRLIFDSNSETQNFDWVNFKFDFLGVNCQLALELDTDYKHVVDEDGSQWFVYSNKFLLNRSMGGSVSPELFLEQEKIYLLIGELAKNLVAKFGAIPIYRQIYTAEEVKANVEQNAKSKLDQELRTIVKSQVKHMRVGAKKEFPLDSVDIMKIPAGEHTFAYASSEDGGNVKKYSLEYVGNNLARLIRVE